MVVAVCVLLPVFAVREAVAQSFFEKLFGLGDNRPAQPVAGARTVILRPNLPSIDRERPRDERPSQSHGDSGPGQTVQTMCVRTCDGYYWPVRYPAARGDLAQDAAICASTCGAQAKLYTRAGPGAEAEEMRDSDGNSYGSTKTAFAYRKGLVNGCSCRGMPWSDGERARHEGYALAEAEKAIRQAMAEADKAALAAAEAERVETDKTHEQMMAQVAAAEALQTVGETGPPMGPAEAAAMARIAHAGGEPALAVAEVATAEDFPRAKGRKATRPQVRGSRQTATGVERRTRASRSQQASARPAPRYAASVQTAPWWAQ